MTTLIRNVRVLRIQPIASNILLVLIVAAVCNDRVVFVTDGFVLKGITSFKKLLQLHLGT
jgi:hypothetical protein